MEYIVLESTIIKSKLCEKDIEVPEIIFFVYFSLWRCQNIVKSEHLSPQTRIVSDIDFHWFALNKDVVCRFDIEL